MYRKHYPVLQGICSRRATCSHFATCWHHSILAMASLSSLGRKSYISQRGLAGVLKELKEQGLPEATSRPSIKRARDDGLAFSTAYGGLYSDLQLEVVDKKKSSDFMVPMLELSALLRHATANLDGFAKFFQERHAQSPSSPTRPWQAAIYNDEVSPGNQLKGQNTRKLQVWYISFMQYGKEHLWREELWIPALVIRSMKVKKVPGGVSAITAELIERMFRNPDHCMETGIALTIGGEPLIVYKKFLRLPPERMS